MARERERGRVSKPAKKSTPTPKNENGDKRRFIELTYKIIEAKVLYYNEELISPGYRKALRVSDDIYDQWEVEYLKLCKKLGYKNAVVHKVYAGLEDVPGEGMMEVDFKRPVVHLVMRKWGIKDWMNKCVMLSDVDKEIIKRDDAEYYRTEPRG